MVARPRAETVTTTALQLISYDPKRTSLMIYNAHTAQVFQGVDNSLTTTNGMPVPAGAFLIYSRDTGDDPRIARFFILAAATGPIRVSEEYGAEAD